MTQSDANKLCEGPQIDIPNILSKYFVLIMTCIFYAPLIPASIPIAMVGSLLFYNSYKYMLLRVNKMPEMFGELMATFFANMMPLILVIWAIAYKVFVERINEDFSEKFSLYHDYEYEKINGSEVETKEGKLSYRDDTPGIAVSCLTLAVLFIFFPVRTIIQNSIPDVEEESDDVYEKVALTFPSDYDKENPLT